MEKWNAKHLCRSKVKTKQVSNQHSDYLFIRVSHSASYNYYIPSLYGSTHDIMERKQATFTLYGTAYLHSTYGRESCVVKNRNLACLNQDRHGTLYQWKKKNLALSLKKQKNLETWSNFEGKVVSPKLPNVSEYKI